MNSATSSHTAEPAALRSEARLLSDRVVATLGLLTVYAWLCIVYLVEAWGRLTPWLFVDELKATQLARGIAATGHAMQRGQPASAETLYSYLLAPFWLFHDVATAYAGVKYFDVFMMASVVFPTYFLARMLVGRKAALFAAAGAGAIPSLAYSSYIVEENVAYPWSALCLFLIAKALVELRRRGAAWPWVVAAAIASLLAPAIRAELGVIPAAFFLALVFMGWTSDWARERRRTWSAGDRFGLFLLALGGIFALSAVMSSFSYTWLVVTQYYKHRALIMGNWAAGALAVGIGVLPLSAGVASLFRLPGEQRSRELRAFRSVLLAALICFGLYTAVKAAYISSVFATRVEERNLIYVSPLLFVGTALVLDRRSVNRVALLVTSAFAAYLVGYALYHPTQYPYEMNVQLYSDSLGLAILQQANRDLAWTPDTARLALLLLTGIGTAALLALPSVRGRARLAGALALVLGIGLVGWTLTGEIAAAAGTNSISRDFATTLSPKGDSFTWVDDITKGKPTLYEGEGEADQIPEWLVEFWNRSISSVGSIDATVGGPGHAGAPNVTDSGQLFWGNDPARPGPEYVYAVEDYPCVDLLGTVRAVHWRRAGGQLRPWRLIQLTRPNRFRSMCMGIYPDGWTGSVDSQYFRFSQGRGWLRVVVSRADAPSNVPPTAVHLALGSIVNGPNREPAFGKAVLERTVTIASKRTKVVWLRSTMSRFALSVVVEKKFVPHDYLPAGALGSGDLRPLGAEISYQFVTTHPTATRHTGR